MPADLETAVHMLGDLLGHDFVAIWALEPSGAVRLRTAHGYGAVLRDPIPADQVDRTLAGALHEGRAVQASFAAGEARPDWAPAGASSVIAAPIGRTGSVRGALLVGRAGTYDEGAADFTVVVAEYLAAVLQQSRGGTDGQRIAASERRRIAQELHDGIAQDLTGIVLALEGCQRALDRDPELLGPQLLSVAHDARATLAEVRRYMTALRQNDAVAVGLPGTLAGIIDDTRRHSGVAIDLDETGVRRELAPFVERALIRIVGEALRNVAQHSAAAHARVRIGYESEGLTVAVADDGDGFDAREVLALAEARGHYGIVGMRERAQGIGGQLVVESQPGRGTTVRATIPYDADRPTPGPEAKTWGANVAVPTPVFEDEEPVTGRTGFLAKLLGR